MPNNNIEFFEIFPWNKNFETGIDLIDKQHKQLVNILNRLAANLANLSSDLILNEIFDELADYADYHFKTEESIWTKYFEDDEWYAQHELTHESFIKDVILIKYNKDKKPLEEVIHEIVSFLSKWLAYHILDTDKRMAKVVLAIEEGNTLEEAKVIADEDMKGLMEVLVQTVLSMYDSLSTRTLDLMREKALRKKAEKSLHLNEERWKLILDGGLENVWDITFDKESVKNDDFIIDIINQEVIKNSKKSIIHPSDILKVKQNLKDHINGETDSYYNKYRLLHEDESWSWILSRGKIVDKKKNGKLRIVGTNSDITQRELASLIYLNSSQAMFILDSKERIISVNPAFTLITGYDKNEVIGKTPRILSSGKTSKEFYKKMWKEINTKGRWSGEIKNKRKNGEIFSEVLNINLVINEHGDIDHYVALFTDISEKKKADETILKQANFDELTKLHNRRMFQHELKKEITKSQRSKLPFALLFVDLDHFKDVNDTLGHEIGDKVLIESANRIMKNIRGSDTIGRFGGDEFTIILSDLRNLTTIDRICESIIEALKEPFLLDLEEIHISASIGVTIYPNDSQTPSELLINADQAMYKAKALGRSRYNYFTNSMQIEAQKRKAILNDLYNALDLNQLEVYYQPIINLATNKVQKAEALLRWNHPKDGLVLPETFIQLAEQSGLIIKIGDWVYKEATKQCKIWKDSFEVDFQMSINKSPTQFKSSTNINSWTDYIKNIGLNGKNINIEITENILMESESIIKDKLLEFNKQGIQIALDDFGTGYSALSYLKKFDIDFIKIDKLFIQNLVSSEEDRILCEAMIIMAHKLNIKVIAEGIETKEQNDLLVSMNCDYAQGFYFSKAIDAKEFEKLYFD